jgi:hypothetical protein
MDLQRNSESPEDEEEVHVVSVQTGDSSSEPGCLMECGVDTLCLTVSQVFCRHNEKKNN